MNLEDPIRYTVYELWTYFSEPPGELLCCPVCENPVSLKAISPSKAASKYSSARVPPDYDGQVYRCKSCTWWAVREHWIDYELTIYPDYLVVGEAADGPKNLPWLQVLEDETLYERPIALPETLGKWFSHGKRRKEAYTD